MVVPSGRRNRQRRKVRSPTRVPLSSSATQVGDGPNGFSSCFHSKNASLGSPAFQPSERRHSSMIAGRSSAVARRSRRSMGTSLGAFTTRRYRKRPSGDSGRLPHQPIVVGKDRGEGVADDPRRSLDRRVAVEAGQGDAERVAVDIRQPMVKLDYPARSQPESPTCMRGTGCCELRLVAFGRSLVGLARESPAAFGLALPGFASRSTTGDGLAQQR
jgi:hypothetical protein